MVYKIKPHRDKEIAPHAGAWIEITKTISSEHRRRIAPHAGAWIEIERTIPTFNR